MVNSPFITWLDLIAILLVAGLGKIEICAAVPIGAGSSQQTFSVTVLCRWNIF